MALCPKCNRNSLEYNDTRKTAWCLYLEDCGFTKQVDSYDAYAKKYERYDRIWLTQSIRKK